MSIMPKSMAMPFLRWSLGLVVLWEGYRFAVSTTAVRHLRAMGLPAWIVPVLGGMEIAAAVVFLVSQLRRVGGYALWRSLASLPRCTFSTGSSRSVRWWRTARPFWSRFPPVRRLRESPDSDALRLRFRV